MSASLGVGGALGLPAAAAMTEQFDWHVLFWSSAAVGAVAAVLVLFLVPESKVRGGGRFDVIGALGMTAGLVSLLLGITKGGAWGWSSGTTLGLFAAAVVVLVLWGVYELRVPQPLVDLRVTARRQVLFTNLASIAVGVGMFTMMLVMPQILQLSQATGYGLGTSLLTAGLVTAPTGLVTMAMAPLSAAVSRSRGPKTTLMIGALIVAAGYGLSLLLMSEVWHFVLVSSVIGAGIGLTFGAMPTLIMGAVPPLRDRRREQPQHPDALARHIERERDHRGDPGPDDHPVRGHRRAIGERLPYGHGRRRRGRPAGCRPRRVPTAPATPGMSTP